MVRNKYELAYSLKDTNLTKKSTRNPKILVIIPARNEEQFIGKTVEALGKQKPKPTKVILVDDGSTDKTSEISKRAAEKVKLDFKVLNRKDRGFTALGMATLAEVYNDGFNSVDLTKFDYLVINGADSLLTPDYFEKILEYFSNNTNLVIASGLCPGEGINVGHVHGSAGRFYQMDFFREDCKGRYEISYAWESIPIFIANINGKQVKSYKEPIVYHLRPRSTRAPDRIHVYRGAAMREVGYWTPYALSRCILTSFRRRQIKAGILMFFGYLKGNVSKKRKILAREYRKYQINLIRNIILLKKRN